MKGIAKMGNEDTLAKLTLYLDYGPIELDGPVATELYEELRKITEIIERNPSQTRYTREIELSDGSVISFTVNKLSGYKYHKGGSPEDRFNSQLNRLTDLVKQHKNEI